MLKWSFARLKSTKGYYFIVLAAALSAIVHVVAKPVLEIENSSFELNPIVMAFAIYMICGLFFTPLSRKTDPIKKITRRDYFFMAAIGLAEVSALIAYFYGLKDSTAVNASIFSNSEIIFSLIIAMVAFKEGLRRSEILPFSMIIVGMMVIPIGTDLYQNGMALDELVMGDALILLSGFLYGVDITLCKYVGDRFDSKRITQVVSFFCAAIALSLIVTFQIPVEINIGQMPSIVTIAIVGTGLSTLFFLIGLKLIGAVRTILLYSTTSIFGVIFSAVFLFETVSTTDIFSIIVVLAGIFLLRDKLAKMEEDPDQAVQHSPQQFAQIKSTSERLAVGAEACAELPLVESRAGLRMNRLFGNSKGAG